MTDLLKIFFPLIFIGGNPFFSRYSISQPMSFKASTKIEIGLCFILSEPVKTLDFFVIDEKYAVRNLIAVPACPTLISFLSDSIADIINWVSSESDKFKILK